MSATGPARPPAPATLAAAVEQLERAVRSAASSSPRTGLISTIGPSGQAASTEMSIVVAGETSRGKSSLVNALLSRTDLLPVQADVTTNVYVVVRNGTPERAEIVLEGEAPRVQGPLSSLAEWGTVSGNPGNTKNVRAIELLIEHPLLARGVMLIDSPGVGGIEAAHAEMTLVALSRADALLFVKDARAPISGPEAAFLTRAAERIETVIVALTKTDLFPGWQTVADQDREFIDRYLPRFRNAPIVPVSSLLWSKAGTLSGAGTESLVEQLRARSGIPELLQVMEQRVVQHGESVRLQNRTRAASSVIDQLMIDATARAATSDGDPAAQSDLQAHRARILEYKRTASTWGVQLQDDFTRLGVDLRQTFSRGLQDLVESGDAPSSALEVEDLADALRPRLVDIVTRLNARLSDGLAEIGIRVRDTLSVEGIDFASVELDVEVERPTIPIGSTVETNVDRELARYRQVTSLTGPVFLLGLLPGFGAISIPVGLMIGAVFAMRSGRRESEKLAASDARQRWNATVSRAVASMKIEVPPAIDKRLLEGRRALEQAARTGIEAKLAELGRVEGELKSIAAAAEADQARARKDAAAAIAELGSLKARAEGLLRASGSQSAPPG